MPVFKRRRRDDSLPESFTMLRGYVRVPVSPEMGRINIGPAAAREAAVGFVMPSPFDGLVLRPAAEVGDSDADLLRSSDVAAMGGWDAVFRQALANLRRLPPPEYEVVNTVPDRTDGQLLVLSTADSFAPSRVFVLDELLAHALGADRPGHGRLVAMPNRRTLVVHEVQGAGVFVAMMRLAEYTVEVYLDSADQVSHDVFYLSREGVPTLVTRPDPNGEGRAAIIDGAFADALTTLGLLADENGDFHGDHTHLGDAD